MAKGIIGVNSNNLFPLIKSALYSDREIFLREMVSNAVDAELKVKTMMQTSSDELPECTEGDLKVTLYLDEENHTLTISDHGIGMTEEEIDKYINQVAFSGVSDFLDKYKDAEGIIGHFGLGFYSAFMVAEKVEILTKSYKKDSPLLRWSCDGSPEFTIDVQEGELSDGRNFGTDVIIHFDEQSIDEFCRKNEIRWLLIKYCRFLPVPIYFDKKFHFDRDKQQIVDEDEDFLVNSEPAIWNIPQQDLTDEDYKRFYRYLYPNEQEPQFWIRLNVSEPFTLKGVLFFPNMRNKINIGKTNNIKLYCNQVFVTDIMDGIVPEFMQLMFGVIDSPDIPLNVSRSYLQGDSEVKKISRYITRKVGDKLREMYETDPKKYEENWEYMKIFVNYGILSTNDNADFWDRIRPAYLIRDTDGNYLPIDDYIKSIEPLQKDAEDKTVVLYTTDRNGQYTSIEAAHAKGYNVCMMHEGAFDIFAIQVLEKTFENLKFTRVDSDSIDHLIQKKDETVEQVEQDVQELMSGIFKKPLEGITAPDGNKTMFMVVCEKREGEDEVLPVGVFQNEFTRRMQDNARFQVQGFNMGVDVFTLRLNYLNPVVKALADDAAEKTGERIKEAKNKIDACQKAFDAVNSMLKDVKEEDRTDEQKQQLQDAQKALDEARAVPETIYDEYSAGNKIISQLVDVALLSTGMLRGEGLFKFLMRTVEFIK